MNPLLIQAFNAEAAVAACKIVKAGTDEGEVTPAAAETDGLLGVCGSVGADADARVDIIMVGIAEVKTAGIIARGDLVTSNASGYGVKLSSTMLEGGACYSIGIALKAAASGDIIPILVIPQLVSQPDAVTASAAEINVLDGIAVGLTAAELSILDGVTANKDELNLLDDQVAGATIVVGADAGTTATVTIQLTKAAGGDMAARSNIKAYLSDDANGDSIVASAPSGGIAIGTDGLLIPIVANKAFLLTSESDGDIDLVVTEAGTKTLYLILVMPNGKLVASGAITFAA